MVNSGTEGPFNRKGAIDWAHYPGIIYIDIPKEERDKYLAVLEVKLDSLVELFKKYGKNADKEVVTQSD
ncbi:hypothetical protein [Fodinibius salsisoli]|uniref:Uncharacterized protein n=1 Tax=Fodinibius salsisoli TaxID=2820877 RepID=A0ABT3PI42_9BACT|nr:hypothetical protein [Fodinibius salsisoli]MCW9705428.1 hypothetical protein [Fodinibius salsisoli]